MYAHRNSSGLFTAKFLQPIKIAYQLRHVCLSVETAETPPQSNLTLDRLPTVNRHITASVHIGHFARRPTSTYGVPRRMLRVQPIHHIRCPDRFEVSLTVLQNRQTWPDPHTLLICNPHVS